MHPAWAPCLDVFTLHYLDRHHHHHHDDVDHVQYTLSISALFLTNILEEISTHNRCHTSRSLL